MPDLEPLPVGDGIRMYLDARRSELADRTLSTHRYRLKQFREWCDEQGIEDLNELSGRDLHHYRVHRQDERDLALSTVKGDLDTLSVFLDVCVSLDAVPPELPDKVRIPSVSKGEGVSEEEIERDRVDTILTELHRFQYASRMHVLARLTWRVGMRLGGLRAIDVDDLSLDVDDPGISLRHRPGSGTPLKNKSPAGERDVNISSDTARIVSDYLDHNRIDELDDHGREPLFATTHGRLSTSALRNSFYKLTRPCERGECPHDRDPSECEATSSELACLCPSARAPHAWRTGSITWQRRQGIPPDVVSERVNASEDVIEEHYDMRSERDKMKQRREHLEELE